MVIEIIQVALLDLDSLGMHQVPNAGVLSHTKLQLIMHMHGQK